MPKRSKASFAALLAVAIAMTAIFGCSGVSLASAQTDILESLKQEVAKRPNAAKAWIKLGTYLFHAQRYAEAEWVMAQAEPLKPKDLFIESIAGMSAYMMGDYPKAESLLWHVHEGSVLQHFPSGIDKTELYKILGYTFYLNNKIVYAEHVLREACKEAPGDWQAQFLLGWVAFHHTDYPVAADALGQARSLNPENASVLRWHAWARLAWDGVRVVRAHDAAKLNLYPEAAAEAARTLQEFRADLVFVREALAENPNSASLYELLARYYFSLGQYRDTLSAIRKSIALDGNQASSHFFLGKTLQKLGDDDSMKEAEAELIESAAIAPEYWEGRPRSLGANVTQLIELLQAEGRFEGAEAVAKWGARNSSP